MSETLTGKLKLKLEAKILEETARDLAFSFKHIGNNVYQIGGYFECHLNTNEILYPDYKISLYEQFLELYTFNYIADKLKNFGPKINKEKREIWVPINNGMVAIKIQGESIFVDALGYRGDACSEAINIIIDRLSLAAEKREKKRLDEKMEGL
ncbi:MAG: hypothetical protein QXI58_00780 [Candidatus Micrarchaeia archaeon]